MRVTCSARLTTLNFIGLIIYCKIQHVLNLATSSFVQPLVFLSLLQACFIHKHIQFTRLTFPWYERPSFTKYKIITVILLIILKLIFLDSILEDDSGSEFNEIK
jgi:hypothetical protein